MKGKVLIDGKRINGKGRLTDKICNKMQNYFGMVIRQNTAAAWNDDQAKALYSTKKGVLVVLWHCTDLQILKIDLTPVQDKTRSFPVRHLVDACVIRMFIFLSV